MTTRIRPRRVGLVAYDDFQLLDLAGPVEVFRAANLLGATRPYETRVVTPTGSAVTSASGITVAADASLETLGSTEILMVIGGFGVDAAIDSPNFLGGLRRAAARTELIASVCTGSLALAAAGLLDGREATTHWASCERMASRHPEVRVQPDRIYVRDGDVWTSAGVTAGIDLALAIVEEHHGRELAHEVAGWLVVFAQRPGGQMQFDAQLRAQAAANPTIADLQRWMADHLDQDLSVAALAARARLSERTFARTFRAETGTTPAAHAEALRIEEARRLLETTDLTVSAVTRGVGYSHGETLHRVFLRAVGTTPDRYRQHFSRQRPSHTHSSGRHSHHDHASRHA